MSEFVYRLKKCVVIGNALLLVAHPSFHVDEIGHASFVIKFTDLTLRVRNKGKLDPVLLSKSLVSVQIVGTDPDDFRISGPKFFQVTLESL